VAGILSIDDAAKVVALRSLALTLLEPGGGMMSVAAPADAVRTRIAGRAELSVAAVNGPAATVVSGDLSVLHRLAAAYAADGVSTRVLPVDYASHSARVEAVRDRIAADLAGIAPRPGRVTMLSAMTGRRLTEADAGAAYWYASLRAPVEFHDAVLAARNGGHDVFVEVSPHPVLATAIEEALTGTADGSQAGNPPVVAGTLRRDDGGPRRLFAQPPG
jgi:acyl transferase domain-containing protein